MESEQSQNFNERLSEWVASQGFWFQIRYSMSGSGNAGTLMFHLLRMGFRVLLFLLVVTAGVGFYLIKRTDMKAFTDGIKTELKSGLNASEIELRGVARVQGILGINGLACKGDTDTYFTSMEARNIRCNMGFLDGLAGQWNPGTVTVSRLDIELRAGADDSDLSKKLGDSLFRKFGNVDLTSFEITDASVRWGYGRTIAAGNLSLSSPGGMPDEEYESDHTRGSITNSLLKIQRLDDEFRLSFKGGKFTQNWLQDLDIVDMVVICTREGMRFEKAEFRRMQGTVDLSGLTVAGGARPLIEGTAKVRNLSLGGVLPPPVRSFVEGTLSGDFKVSGSTNSSDGITFEGPVTLDSQDLISLRERLHLLKALSVVDYSRNYHRIDFREGSFHLKTSGGGADLTDINLISDDQITLEGKLSVRLPTLQETRDALEKGAGPGSAPIFNGEDSDLESLESKADDAFSLRRAALAAKREKEGGAADTSGSLFDQFEDGMLKRRLDAQASERLSRTLRYDGLFRITLPPDAFERAPRLVEQYPVDARLNRIPMMVPIEGGLYEITLKQAEDIYQQGRR